MIPYLGIFKFMDTHYKLKGDYDQDARKRSLLICTQMRVGVHPSGKDVTEEEQRNSPWE